jgi:hypothetical protein
VINTANGFLIYDPVTQAARVVRVTHGGGVSMGTAYGFSYWNIILGRSTFLFFYSTIGMAYVGYVDTLGQVVGTDYWPWGFGVWTHIVATDNNLVFYNASSGIIAVGHMSVDAKWGGQTDAFHMIQGCTSVTTTGQYVLCYNRQSGLLQTMHITENGYALPKDVADVGVDYTHVVPQAEHVVLYSSERGATRVGHLDDGGLWVGTDQSNVVMDVPLSSVPAGTVTSTGDALLFYNSTWGVATVGKVSREGKLTLTDRVQLEKGWTDIVATAR